MPGCVCTVRPVPRFTPEAARNDESHRAIRDRGSADAVRGPRWTIRLRQGIRFTDDPAAARALLDRFGYKDRDGDGYRERPDGTPLVLVQNSMPDTISRQNDELWLKNVKALGLRLQIRTAPFNELLKQSSAGQLQIFDLGCRAPSPSGFAILSTLWGRSPPDTNQARFRHADCDAAYAAFVRAPPGPQRNARARRMSEIVSACAPILYRTYPLGHAFVQPWLKGYYPASFGFTWKYVDIDLARKRAARK